MSESAWCVGDFYAPRDKTALYEQIPRRYSCRRFLAAPSAVQWDALGDAAQRLCPPRVRVALAHCSPKLFQTLGARMLKFENVRCCALVISRDGSPESVINAGVGGEMFMLEAIRLGVAGVWVSGSYSRAHVPAPLEQGERLLAVIALGLPFEEEPARTRKRKPVEKLVEGGAAPKGGLLADVAAMVRLAPSAMNLQPWRLSQGEDGEISLRVHLPASRLDLGIAAAHAILALGNTPVRMRLSDDFLAVRMKPVL